jgi:hypothetical protein
MRSMLRHKRQLEDTLFAPVTLMSDEAMMAQRRRFRASKDLTTRGEFVV